VPLSEHEQHLLEQMEQALYTEDPKFASHMVGSTARRRLRHRIALGVTGGVVGLALVVLGVMNQLVWLGGLGFVIMVAGAVWAISPPGHRGQLGAVREDGTVETPPRGRPGKKSAGGGKTGKAPGRAGRKNRGGTGSHGSFMQRMEQRWDRRRGTDWH
jgi:hypothetical protein